MYYTLVCVYTCDVLGKSQREICDSSPDPKQQAINTFNIIIVPPLIVPLTRILFSNDFN